MRPGRWPMRSSSRCRGSRVSRLSRWCVIESPGRGYFAALSMSSRRFSPSRAAASSFALTGSIVVCLVGNGVREVSRSTRVHAVSASNAPSSSQGSRFIAVRSGEPALASLVELRFAEALAARLRDAEVELLGVLVLAQHVGGAVHHDAAVLEDVAVVRVLQ